MKDNFGRDVTYMRISVTDRCNLRCSYCMPESGVENLGHENILSFEEIESIAETAVELGITKFRLTGGEPLVRKGIVSLTENIAKIEGVTAVTMTTNGILLPGVAEDLKNAGLQRLNISLDTLNHTKYREITRGGDLDQAFDGINAAVKADLKPIKINVVVIKGFNDDEIMDFVQLTYQFPYEIRFIELMPIGQANVGEEKTILSADEIKKRLPALRPIDGDGGVAERYRYPGAMGTLGFITPMSCNFCSECNKIRLTADGKIKPCLHSNMEIDLNPALKAKDKGLLKELLVQAIMEKDERHLLNDGAAPIERDMNKIGG